MKKLLTLTALIAGVALFAGCMNKPVEEQVTVEETPAVEEVVTEQITPEVTHEATTGEATPEVTTGEVIPQATAE